MFIFTGLSFRSINYKLNKSRKTFFSAEMMRKGKKGFFSEKKISDGK